MVQTARERLRDSGARFLIDAYCGVGFFSIELADCVEYFTGIEIDAAAIKAARRNAQNHGKANGEFIAGAAEGLLGAVLDRFDPAATAVIVGSAKDGLRARIAGRHPAAPARSRYCMFRVIPRRWQET